MASYIGIQKDYEEGIYGLYGALHRDCIRYLPAFRGVSVKGLGLRVYRLSIVFLAWLKKQDSEFLLIKHYNQTRIQS